VSTGGGTHRPVLVAIPAKNEAEEIGGCLRALAQQEAAAIDAVVICLNNCTDNSADVVRWSAKALPFPVVTLDVLLPPQRACAGMARRIAMDHAAALAGPPGVLLTTDADGRPPPHWVAANLAAIGNGIDAVAGQAEIEPVGAKLIPAHLHAIDARECAYASLLDEIRSLLDPDPFDPWPRHDEHSGCSIAVTVETYRRAGGMPPAPLAEDRAFFDALKRVDRRVRHAAGLRVVVSARIVGRAPEGMADAMRRRMQRVDPFIDERLEPVSDAARRILLRKHVRHLWQTIGTSRAMQATLAAKLRITAEELRTLTDARYFGTAWAAVEQRIPILRRRPVALIDLPAQTARATRLRDALRAGDVKHGADPDDTGLRVAAE
jgi:hypothetical protein